MVGSHTNLKVLRRQWIPLVSVWVVVLVPLLVACAAEVLDDQPQPMTATDSSESAARVSVVVYEVFGSPGANVIIDYIDDHAQATRIDTVSLPWRYGFTTADPRVAAGVTAQPGLESIGCRIFIDGQLRDEQHLGVQDGKARCSTSVPAAIPSQPWRDFTTRV